MIAPNNDFFFAYNKLVLDLAKRSGANAKRETQRLSQIKNLFKDYWNSHYTTKNAILYNTKIKFDPLAKGSMLIYGTCCCERQVL